MTDQDDLDREILQDFLVESYENLDQLDQDLVALEQQPDNRQLLASVFRTIHTIKGTSGFLAFGRLERLTHAGESMLALLRDGVAAMNPETADLLLRMVDVVRVMLASIERSGVEGDTDIDTLVAELHELVERRGAPAEPVAAAVVAPAEAPVAEVTGADAPEPAAADADADAAADAGTEGDADAEGDADTDAEDDDAEAHAEMDGESEIAARGEAEATAATGDPEEIAAQLTAVADAVAAVAAVGAPAAPGEPAAGAPAAPAAEAVVAPPAPSRPKARAPKASPVDAAAEADADVNRPAVSDSTVRVDLDLLEQLVRLAGELVLARNQIVQRAHSLGDEDLGRACHRLNLVASELQEGVMRTRMQPIDHIWAKLPRVVRDLGSQLGRSVRLEMEGGETELDRTLLEAVKDPLTHLVRNAIDHGIEPADVRQAKGKPATGLLRLRAAHEGGQILLEVSDDGAGIDPARIGAKAVALGIMTEAQVEAKSPADLLRLVFLPGFSTASKVTNVSGRGVGMDVVRTNIERIGGSIDVDSTIGAGTVWRLRIPLTLAIVPALTVLCADQRYAVPQVNLLELVSLDGQRGDKSLEDVGGAKVFRLRGSLLPVVRLSDMLGLAEPADGPAGNVIAVLESDGRRFGLVVDRVLDTEEIVVKPLSGALKEIGLYAGATILGDGRVSLILDVQSLARRSIRAGESVERIRTDTDDEATAAAERQLLVVDIGSDQHVAIPLEVVTRLEQFPAESIERVGHREVVRYRGAVLPIVRLGNHLGTTDWGSAEAEGTSLPCVVYSTRGRGVALVVRGIVDIVTENTSSLSDVDDVGLVGSAVLRDRVTGLLDVRSAILAADPNFYSTVDSDFDESQQLGEHALSGDFR